VYGQTFEQGDRAITMSGLPLLVAWLFGTDN
jgi:hypothetical protein